MPNFTTHLTKTSIALMIGIATITLLVETYSEFEFSFKIMIYSGFCCLVGGSAPDIDHKDSIPAIALWCVLLLVMSSGFLRIYLDYIDVLLPDLTFLGKAVLMYGVILVLVPLSRLIYENFQDRVPHRKFLHEMLKTGAFTATLGAFVLPFSYVDGGVDLLMERALYLASFQYGVVVHILLDRSRIVRMLLT